MRKRAIMKAVQADIEALPVQGELEAKQQEAVDGPDGPPMESFTCIVCNNRYFDMKQYFYGTASVRCLWCEKYGKVAKKATEKTVDQKS